MVMHLHGQLLVPCFTGGVAIFVMAGLLLWHYRLKRLSHLHYLYRTSPLEAAKLDLRETRRCVYGTFICAVIVIISLIVTSAMLGTSPIYAWQNIGAAYTKGSYYFENTLGYAVATTAVVIFVAVCVLFAAVLIRDIATLRAQANPKS